MEIKIVSKSGSSWETYPNSTSFGLTITVPDGYIAIGSGTSFASGDFLFAGCSSSISTDRKTVNGSFSGGKNFGGNTPISGTLYAYCVPDVYTITVK